MAINFNERKWEVLFNDQAMKQELEAADSPERVKEILAKYHVEVTDEELRELICVDEAELSAEDLDEVAGGAKKQKKVVGFAIVVTLVPPRIKMVPIYR